MDNKEVHSKEKFYLEIKNAAPFCENFNIILVLNGKNVASLSIICNDAVVKFVLRCRTASLLTQDFCRKRGESVPIDEIIEWFENKIQ